ncbi:hypothetical protein B0H13DRAFT_2359820 [Mycena leptocephala]|nr:hypothetical protein B0H13DRAFT_2359820 [Mycena leptocephala]
MSGTNVFEDERLRSRNRDIVMTTHSAGFEPSRCALWALAFKVALLKYVPRQPDLRLGARMPDVRDCFISCRECMDVVFHAILQSWVLTSVPSVH